jgi:NAD(P)-dependent dehydrogenase (short-subunit alcohol dehydrogenase family)
MNKPTMVVTGAGAGIGRAVALRLTKAGFRVVGVDIDSGRLLELAQEASDIVTVRADISDENDVAAIRAAAGDDIAGLANVAGVMDDFSGIHEVSDEVWARVFRVNVEGLMRMTRAHLPAMVARGAGSIVNIASIAAARGSVAGVAYTASKHAVVGITRSTAVLYGPAGVRCNVVAPGSVITSIDGDFSRAPQLTKDRVGALRDVIRPPAVQPDSIAATVCYLLGDDSSNINGAIIPSDGGWSAT